MRMIAKALVALALVFTGVAEAQGTVSVLATIPFDFYVGNQPLPAGEYAVYSLRESVVLLRASDNPASTAMAIHHFASKRVDAASDTNHLVFNKYSPDRIFLSQVWRAGATQGASLPMSRREREAVTSQLITGNRPATVTVLAKVR